MPIYLRECLIENSGPIDCLDLSLQFTAAGNPKPLILVGQNGAGKTIALATIVDALVELAKLAYRDAVRGQVAGYTPYFKHVADANIRSRAAYGVSLLEFSGDGRGFGYVEKVGSLDPAQ